MGPPRCSRALSTSALSLTRRCQWAPHVRSSCSVANGTSRVSRWIQDQRLVSFGTFGPPREPFISAGSTVHSSPQSRARLQTRPRRFKVSRWIFHQRSTLDGSRGRARAVDLMSEPSDPGSTAHKPPRRWILFGFPNCLSYKLS